MGFRVFHYGKCLCSFSYDIMVVFELLLFNCHTTGQASGLTWEG